MEFDKSKVYTSVNADKLKVGSFVYTSDTMSKLKDIVEKEQFCVCFPVQEILNENESKRFVLNVNGMLLQCAMVYLISEPKEETYRPYKDDNEAFLYLHDKWLINKCNGSKYKVIGFYKDLVLLNSVYINYDDLLKLWEIYSITGKNEPCGVKINGCN